ncbi:MAG TPA: hypothetical protein VGQ93_07380 [Lysobacter sp.]|jgi:hypothetical protein|nr:hypothetical protein [Lysobacter sp.]
MNTTTKYLGQAVLYGAFALAIGYFSTSPAYTLLAPGQALLKLSFSHGAQRLGACRDRSDEELAKLPPNMRIRQECPRERAPVIVELELDGAPLYRESLPPSGLSGDGSASVYRRFVVPAGTHRLVARLSDNAEGEFNYRGEKTVTLAPAQIVVVEFHAAAGFRFLQ